MLLEEGRLREGGPYDDRRLKPALRRLDGAGGGVPSDGDVAAEAGLVDHVTGERGVVAEDGVFGEGLARLDGREVGPEVRTNVVEVVASKNVVFEHRLFADFGVMFLVPLF